MRSLLRRPQQIPGVVHAVWVVVLGRNRGTSDDSLNKDALKGLHRKNFKTTVPS